LSFKLSVSSVPKSPGQQALRKIRSLEHFPAVSPPMRSTAAALKHRRYWPFPARRVGLRIVAIEESGGGLETEIKRSPLSAYSLRNRSPVPKSEAAAGEAMEQRQLIASGDGAERAVALAAFIASSARRPPALRPLPPVATFSVPLLTREVASASAAAASAAGR
jgi:hypothetical protein